LYESEGFRVEGTGAVDGEAASPRAVILNPTTKQISSLMEMANFMPVDAIELMNGNLGVPMDVDDVRAVVTVEGFNRPIDSTAMLFYGFERDVIAQGNLADLGMIDEPAKSTDWLDAIRAGVLSGRITTPAGVTWRDVAALQINRGLADYDLMIQGEKDFAVRKNLQEDRAKVAAYYADLGIENIVQ